MAQDLFIEIQFLSKGDFTQPDVIEKDIIIGKKLPSSEVIFKSEKDQIIFLELWNETEKPVSAFIRISDRIYMNNAMGVSQEQIYAHTFHQINIKEGEVIYASAEQEKSISYNIIL